MFQPWAKEEALKRFMKEQIDEIKGETIRKSEFYEAYVTWCKRNDLLFISNIGIGRYLPKYFGIKPGQQRIYKEGGRPSMTSCWKDIILYDWSKSKKN